MTSEELVQRWLKDRQHLLVELVDLSRGLRSRSTALDSLSSRMQQFCDRLVDYVSTGHFEVYADLASAPQGSRLLTRLWSQLQNTTDTVLNFNETSSSGRLDRHGMALQLATLSVALEDRFSIEDRLVLVAKAAAVSRPSASSNAHMRAPAAVQARAQAGREPEPAAQPIRRPSPHVDDAGTTPPSVMRTRRNALAAVSATT